MYFETAQLCLFTMKQSNEVMFSPLKQIVCLADDRCSPLVM